jgi:hypothetical protein
MVDPAKASQTGPQFPRFIHARNEFARRHGLLAISELRKVDKERDELGIFTIWEGTEADIRSLRIINPKVRLSDEYNRCSLRGFGDHPRCGNLTATQDGRYLLEFDGVICESMRPHNRCDAIETMTLRRWTNEADPPTIHHGAIDDLIRVGLITDDQVPASRIMRKRHGFAENGGLWKTHLEPDGTIVYEEPQESHERRKRREGLEKFGTGERLRQQMEGSIELMRAIILSDSSGQSGAAHAEDRQPPCWASPEDHQRLVELFEEVTAVIQNARFIERKPAGPKFRLITGGK